MAEKSVQRTVEVTAHDLPLHCPTPDAPLWNQHPRVFLDVLHAGDVTCPYCSTHYVFKGEAPKGH
ncbi:MAG: zinc-finger domain-containing protein [Propionivibrio sp.]